MIAVEILRNEHAVILGALDLLERHARDVQSGGALNDEFARWMLQFINEFAEAAHHAKEEGVLFGLLERLAPERMSAAVRRMREEHDAARRQLHAMEFALADGDAAFAASARLFADRLRRHLLLEGETLFAAAEELMKPADDAAALEAFGNVVHAGDGVRVRQRHLAAIERWRNVFGDCRNCP